MDSASNCNKIDVEFVSNPYDAAAWFKDCTIYVNLYWLNERDAPDWINTCFIHEYVEHVLGLGHESAVFVENVLRRLLE